jgi:protein-disulfide isomerase
LRSALALLAVLAACDRGEHERQARLDHVVSLLHHTLLEAEREQRRAVAEAGPLAPAPPEQAVAMPVDTTGAVAFGPAGAPVTLVLAVELFDPYSARLDPTLEQLEKAFPTQLRVVKMSFLTHPKENLAATIGLCAAQRQGPAAFRRLERRLWQEKTVPAAGSRELLLRLAGELGLDVERFDRDLADPTCLEQVNGEKARLAAVGVTRTPTLILNGRQQTRTRFDDLRAAVVAALAATR